MSEPELLRAARRPLCLGIGGGGDVVGALATAEHCRLQHDARPVLGGVTWERRPIDPQPGPRSAAEIAGARPIGPAVLAAGPDTRVRSSGVRFAESRMAELLGEEVLLVDANEGPATIAAGLGAAAAELGCDLLAAVDVGGDVLAHGHEPGLGSPLCDAVLLAAAVRLEEQGELPVLGAVFGIGCDGELTPDEVLERLAELEAAGATAGAIRMTEPVAARLEQAADLVPTEASAMAVHAYRGQTGTTAIRAGRRTVDLRPIAAETRFFRPAPAISSAARLAAAVMDAGDLEAANEALHALGVYTELDWERDAPHTAPGPDAAP
ncbi:MAG: DUF1152 domain-containing protein [Thermoleophilaceae bacterium]